MQDTTRVLYIEYCYYSNRWRDRLRFDFELERKLSVFYFRFWIGAERRIGEEYSLKIIMLCKDYGEEIGRFNIKDIFKVFICLVYHVFPPGGSSARHLVNVGYLARLDPTVRRPVLDYVACTSHAS